MSNTGSVAAACDGAACVVSALNGLHDVIVDRQSVLLDAAVKAGVPRFISSDYSADFTKTTPGDNRNCDLRREFMARTDRAPIKVTSILNGAFMDMLGAELPIIQPSIHRVLYWSDADQLLDFTTKDDVAVCRRRRARRDYASHPANRWRQRQRARHRKCNERGDRRALSNDVGRQHRVARRHDPHREAHRAAASGTVCHGRACSICATCSAGAASLSRWTMIATSTCIGLRSKNSWRVDSARTLRSITLPLVRAQGSSTTKRNEWRRANMAVRFW
jgi:hypothetical protein